METPDDSLRLVLISLNELKQVAVLAAPEGFGLQLHSMGVVKGKEQLAAFLEMAEVDHYVVCYGEPFVTTFRSAPFAHDAQQIIAGLEKGIREAGELRQKIEKGDAVSEEERVHLRLAPRTWTLWSSSLKSDEGMERVRAWFSENKAKADEGAT
jgi:hypothetical protein